MVDTSLRAQLEGCRLSSSLLLVLSRKSTLAAAQAPVHYNIFGSLAKHCKKRAAMHQSEKESSHKSIIETCLAQRQSGASFVGWCISDFLGNTSKACIKVRWNPTVQLMHEHIMAVYEWLPARFFELYTPPSPPKIT